MSPDIRRRPSVPAADPVLALLADGRGDARSLYYLWEQQQWEAGKIDLAVDAEQWTKLDPGARRPVADSLAWRRMRAELATTALVPLVDVAPDEEQQVFLTTQLVDEARQLVFFDRVLVEVAGERGQVLEERKGIVDEGVLRSLLTEVVPAEIAALRADGAGPRELASAVVTYHLVVLGVLGLTEQDALAGYLQDEEILPGVRQGLALEARDAHRHVAFGLGLLTRTLDAHPDVLTTLRASLEQTLPLALAALSAAGDSAPTPYSGEDLKQTATSALDLWCRGVDMRLAVPG